MGKRLQWAVLALVLLAGCASQGTGEGAAGLTEGISASFRVRVEERLLLEGLLGFAVFTASQHREEAMEWEADLTVMRVEQQSATLAFRLRHIQLVSPEAKALPDLAVTARVHPRTGKWLGLDPLPGGAAIDGDRLEGWLRRLFWLLPAGGQEEPGTFWVRAEPFSLEEGEVSVRVELPWRVEHERTDQLADRPVVSLRLERQKQFEMAGRSGQQGSGELTGTYRAWGIARVDTTGLVRSLEIQETGHFGYPMTALGPRAPWRAIQQERRFTVIRIHPREE